MRRILLLILFIVFWFKGNTLYWNYEGDLLGDSKYNWLQFQLNHNDNPDINKEPIDRIIVDDFTVRVLTKDKYWVVHYYPNPENKYNWYVDDWRSLL